MLGEDIGLFMSGDASMSGRPTRTNPQAETSMSITLFRDASEHC